MDGTDGSHSRRARVFNSGEGIINKGDITSCVVNANVKFAAASTTHNVGFNLLITESIRARETSVLKRSDKFKKLRDVDGGVNLGKLGEKTGEDSMLEEGKVLSIASIRREGSKKRSNRGAKRKRIESNF